MRILHLEDNPVDAHLVAEVLAREWPQCTIAAVATRPAFVAALDGGGYDVILSDFTLASFNGIEALELAKQKAPDTPFVFFTGTLGEDRAIDAVLEGAADYVLKDHMKRLVTAVRRSLRESQERRQRRQAEAANRRLLAIFDHTPDFVAMASPDGRILYLNRAGRQLLGLPPEADPTHFTVRDFHPPEIAAFLSEEAVAEAARDGSWTGETILLALDGRHLPVSQVVIAHKHADGTIAYLSTILRDLTTQRRQEAAVRELVSLLDKARDAIIVSELDGRVTFWNHGAERLSGWTSAQAIGRRVEELFGPEAKTKIAAARETLDSTGQWRGEFHLHHRDGQPFVVEIGATLILGGDGRPRARLTIATDITDRKKLEERLLRAQRMESIGMLAAGIAHDLNNVLAPIMMVAPMLREHMTDATDLQMLAMLEKSTQRGAGLIRQILGFAHGVAGGPKLLQIKHLVRDLSIVINETFPKNIRYEESLDPNLWPVRVNATHIHQVLLNLCVNARDAMPSGGTLRLRAENSLLDDAGARAIEGGRPGRWLALHVEDTGSGIPADVLARIWDPFFTTKENGKGTGLGLSTVRGIVENHEGFVQIETAVGQGTAFRVYLPAADAGDEPGTTDSVHPFLPRGNGELILVVDDEINVRDVTAATLARHGYRVLSARDGTEALALFSPRWREIALVLTDLNMPKLDGATVAGVVHRLNPAVKIVIASGHSPEGRPTTTEPPPFADALLAKPFNVETLLTTVSRLLHSPAPEKDPA